MYLIERLKFDHLILQSINTFTHPHLLEFGTKGTMEYVQTGCERFGVQEAMIHFNYYFYVREPRLVLF